MTASRPDRAALAQLGRELHARGLSARGLALWSGSSTLARLPARLAAAKASIDAATDATSNANRSPAAFALELLVAGRAAAADEAQKRLGAAAVEALLALELIAEEAGQLRARRAVVPVTGPPESRGSRGEPALAVCDRWDATATRDSTPWPDDSSHHLCGALGGLRAERWLDLGTGSGLAPLAHRALAQLVIGADLVVPTARAAALGAALSDHRRFHIAASDLDDAIAGEWDLVTCNAPIPAEPGAHQGGESDDARPRWRHAEADFLERLCQRVPDRLRRGGLAVLHARADALGRALGPTLGGLGGDAVTVVYTPPGVTPFGVTWWQPHLPSRRLVVHRTLTPQRPHLDVRDRDDATNNRLAPLPEAPAS